VAPAGHLTLKMVRIGLMASRISHSNRRDFLAGLGAVALGPSLPGPAAAEAKSSLTLHAQVDTRSLRPADVDALLWEAEAGPRLGDRLSLTFSNDLPVAAALSCRGLDGAPTLEPLLSQTPLATGGSRDFQIPFRFPGTYFFDLRLLGDSQGRPSRALAIMPLEDPAPTVDRDEKFVIQDWRLNADGTALSPGTDAKHAPAIFTVNGLVLPDVAVHSNQRLRLRVINACQRHVVAVKIERIEVRVMAIDSRPAEPFLARNSALVLAPGGRVDAFIDVTTAPSSTSQILLHDGKEARPIARLVVSAEPPPRPAPLAPAPPLPSNGLPVQLDLKNAQRVDLTLQGAEWVVPTNFTSTASPAFRAKPGRVVVLALTNRAPIATVFHLHGHHFRLLDRLDDGWKPFWLDTLAIEPDQTQRIAFLAEYSGRYLLESTATDWAAPRLLRWYSVE
jgi:FtsP/CotA-like multicopper oxidase with cupredoxin domain